MQQIGQHRTVGDIGRRRHRRVDQLAAAVDAEMRLHAEIPLVALLRLMHLGIARLLGILGRTGRIDNGRIDDGAGCHLQSPGRQMPLDLVKQPPAQIVRLEKMAETAHRSLVGHRLASEVDANKLPHRQQSVLGSNAEWLAARLELPGAPRCQ